MSKIYEIDPEADTLVVVPPLAEGFAPWPTTLSSGPTNGHTSGLANGHGHKHTNGIVVPVPAPAEVRIKASSKHLSLASQRFRDLLAAAKTTPGSPVVGKLANGANGPNGVHNINGATNGKLTNGVPRSAPAANALWRSSKETKATTESAAAPATPEKPDGRVHLVLEGVDADAVVAVLNIVHGRAGKGRVPKTVTLEALARIAVVVDQFKLQDAVEAHAERWLEALHGEASLETASARDLLLWAYVAYVFENAAVFEAATRLLAPQLAGPLPALANLPLRPVIAHDLDVQRQAVVAQALDVVYGAVDALVTIEDDEDDTYNTDAFYLGSLLRALRRHGAYSAVPPPPPYAGVSVAALSTAAHEAQTAVFRLALRVGDLTRSNRTNNVLQLAPRLDALRHGATGLRLTSEHGFRLY